jgi:hypothetical protein
MARKRRTRVATPSRIITSAHRINQGSIPDLSTPEAESDFYNGDIGYINDEVDPNAGEIVTSFDGRSVTYTFERESHQDCGRDRRLTFHLFLQISTRR